MKSIAVRWVAMIATLAGCFGILAAAPPEEETGEPRVEVHASLAAYPQAIVSFKVPDTGALYYVETNGRRLVAFDKEGAVAWSVDILGETKMPSVRGTPVIRHLRQHRGSLRVTCGRSHEVEVDPTSGKTRFLGND